MSDFKQSLLDIVAEHQRKKNEFEDAWVGGTRRLIYQVFTDAASVLNDAKVEHDNGTSSTLYWRGKTIAFKVDERRLKIVRVREGEPEESYDPSALTQDKVESEVRSFVRAVLQG